ncbi:BlaI/MecI/CopY family transcriptional regulator [Bariatricus sp. SGI.154]|uniref:BlaI/MecI/CopY family transcriptional regulator n=1 Tax=Bariatricus sp. SGI.154 TaxID=3420549 RepID=UPI003D06CF67
MKKKLSKRQLEVMKILWNNTKPMVASDIVKANPSLNINTVQACLKVLIKEKAIEVADIVYSGTVLTRSYRALISKTDYFNDVYRDIIGGSSASPLIASFIQTEESLEELNELQEMITKRKKEIEEDK